MFGQALEEPDPAGGLDHLVIEQRPIERLGGEVGDQREAEALRRLEGLGFEPGESHRTERLTSGPTQRERRRGE